MASAMLKFASARAGKDKAYLFSRARPIALFGEKRALLAARYSAGKNNQGTVGERWKQKPGAERIVCEFCSLPVHDSYSQNACRQTVKGNQFCRSFFHSCGLWQAVPMKSSHAQARHSQRAIRRVKKATTPTAFRPFLPEGLDSQR